MEITKGKPVVFEQKIEKGIKAYHQKNKSNHKERQQERKKQKNYQIVRK